jgi:hypothetical protein
MVGRRRKEKYLRVEDKVEVEHDPHDDEIFFSRFVV